MKPRPVLRYHGGKWLLAPFIISHFPRHRIYTEVYGGAASVLLRKPRSYSEVYNDLDGQVVNLFRVLQRPLMAAELVGLLKLTPFARAEFELAYEPCDEPVESARRLVVRSFMGFGSAAHNSNHGTGFRACSNRSGTTPARDWAHYPDALAAIVARLRGVLIESRPALQALGDHDAPDVCHYVDPPYVHATRKERQQQNYRHEMDDDDHRELSEVLHGLAGMVVLSGYPSALYDELYGSWRRVDRAAHADGARKRTESLWFNPAATAGLSQGSLL